MDRGLAAGGGYVSAGGGIVRDGAVGRSGCSSGSSPYAPCALIAGGTLVLVRPPGYSQAGPVTVTATTAGVCVLAR